MGLSFSEFGVLMSTPSSEKDSPKRLPVPMETAPQFFKKEVFYVTPFIIVISVYDTPGQGVRQCINTGGVATPLPV